MSFSMSSLAHLLANVFDLLPFSSDIFFFSNTVSCLGDSCPSCSLLLSPRGEVSSESPYSFSSSLAPSLSLLLLAILSNFSSNFFSSSLASVLNSIDSLFNPISFSKFCTTSWEPSISLLPLLSYTFLNSFNATK